MAITDDAGTPGDALADTVLMGKWRIVRALAKGGMSTVYEAVHRNGRRAAVKILHPAIAADERGRARFLRESSLANKLNHRGVVAVLDEDVTPLSERRCYPANHRFRTHGRGSELYRRRRSDRSGRSDGPCPRRHRALHARR